jgi:hypothetical protein
MKNIALDLMMGLLCIVLTCTFIGILVVPVAIDYWKDMRS